MGSSEQGCRATNEIVAEECTEAQLETAAKKGFSAEVRISNGIATTITDDH
ncbi:hypothetical protein GCM10023084_70400 [Streptomyces lacrimifluminis]|uniref:Uncharacterized protein n=1 Tax=Streptomyces lacrimifluminis TaxID=1500077 RepID=A0A917UJA1_9ACTN|nr:hypothetical protein [Streptomyces lacrimifluminis]GGJ62134.1 hypothetical protein GCM10012282_69170 [Streptomyces lacrimifluminis]